MNIFEITAIIEKEKTFLNNEKKVKNYKKTLFKNWLKRKCM